MSKKTDNIYKAIENLNGLQQAISRYNRNQKEISHESREMEDVEFQMQQELRNLKFWIDSLYAYNGKSTSRAKKLSSKENGKKGGRPPKLITELRRRRKDLEDNLIPELIRKRDMQDDIIELQKIEEQLSAYDKEISEITAKLDSYKK